MRIKVSQASFLDIEFDDSQGNTSNNSDTYVFTLTTPGGQSCMINGKEVETFSFSIVGNIEMGEFFDAIMAIRRVHGEAP